MRYLFFYLISLCSFLSYSQSNKYKFYMVSEMRKDSLNLHWVPESIKEFSEMVANDVLVEVISWNSKESPVKSDFLNNPTKRSYKIESRLDLINKDSSCLSPAAVILINGVLNAEDTNASKMLFVNTLLLSSVDRELSKELGLYLTLKPAFNSSYFALKMTVNNEVKSVHVSKNQVDNRVHFFDSLNYEFNSNEVTLFWDQSEIKKYFSSYFIEKSFDKKNFLRLNSRAHIHLVTDHELKSKPASFVDKTIKKGDVCYYRIIGINHLGFETGCSNLVKVIVPRPIEGGVLIDSIFFNESIRVSSSFIGNEGELDFLKYSVLLHSDSIYGKYEVLKKSKIKNKIHQFSIKPNEIKERGYFKFAMISKTMDTLFSEPRYYFFRDSIPPVPVSKIEGKIDTNGVVMLKWDKVEDHLNGYRLFRTNSLSEEFVELTKKFCTDTTYVDTLSLNNLSKYIYYAIITTDLNFNNSILSEPILLEKPDLIPPAPSYIKNYQISPKGINLNVVASSSSDVAGLTLIKQFSEKSVFLDISREDSSYLDSDIQQGIIYSYNLRTCDSSGNCADSKKINVNYELGYRELKTKLNFLIDRERNELKLYWENDKNIYSTDLYISKNDGAFSLKSVIKGESYEILKDLPINNKFKFKIQQTNRNGIKSKMSDVISIEY